MTTQTLKVQSPRTGNIFSATFPTADAAYDWIASHDLLVIDAPDDVMGIVYGMQEADTVYCSICDGIGHGQPGYGPCPLEDRGWMDTFEEEARGLRF